MTTSRSTDRTLCRELPHPLAIAWRRYLLARSEASKVEQLIGALDVFLRLLTSYLLSDYLQRPPVSAVENELPKLTRPSLGTYRALIREMLRAIHGEDEVLFGEIARWHFKTNGKPTKIAKVLDQLVSMRNEHAHGHARTEAALRPYREEFEVKIRDLLRSASWLFSFRLFYVLDVMPSRTGGSRGSIQWFIGDAQEPIPEDVNWEGILFPGTVYLCHPSGEQFLELTPFVQILPHESAKRCFLFLETHRKGLITLRLDAVGVEQQRFPQVLGEDTSWDDFLEKREQRTVVVQNTKASDFKLPNDEIDDPELFGTRYRLIRKIGAGAMAEVFAVEDIETGKAWALKVIRQELVNERGKERFQREIQLQYTIKHPHILAIDSVTFLSDGRCAIQMEWMEAGTLKDKLEEELCTPEEVSKWTEQLLDALQYLDKHGIVHRDIKPSNVLLSDEGQVKIADFGIARRDGDIRITRTEEKVGSWPYMAPEIRLGKSKPSFESDLYSLAVTLHELLTGELSDQPGEGISGSLGARIRAMASRNSENRRKAFTISPTEDPESSIASKMSQPEPPVAPEVSQPEPAAPPPKRSCFSTGVLGCFGMFLLFCVGPCIPLPGKKVEEGKWSEKNLAPIKEAYMASTITESEIKDRLAVLRKDIASNDVYPPPDMCFQNAVVKELGDLKGQDGYRLGSFEDADGNPRTTPLSPPKAVLPSPDKAILTPEEAKEVIIRTMSNVRKEAESMLEDAENSGGSLAVRTFRGCARDLMLDSMLDSIVENRERGLQKTLTEVSERRYSTTMLIEAIESQKEREKEKTPSGEDSQSPSETDIEADGGLQEGTLLDIYGILIDCSVNNFILSSSDMGGGKAGVKLEFLPEQFDAMWAVQIGEPIHARCVIEGMGQQPYWLSSCVRIAPHLPK